jgi:hypothetical protein
VASAARAEFAGSMLSNWTLHQTHATPVMMKTREYMELRFWPAASLNDILREHGI